MNFKARFHETALYWWNQPLQYAFMRATKFLGPVSYLKFNNTHFVNDPLLTRTILTDTDNFSLVHGGGLGYLIEQIMGKNAPAFFNLEGEAHMNLKRDMVLILNPDYITKIIHQALTPELDHAIAQVKSNHPLDLVRLAQRCTARLSCHMVGITDQQPNFEHLITLVSKLNHQLSNKLSATRQYPSQRQMNDARQTYVQFTDLLKDFYEHPNLPSDSIMSKCKQKGFTYEQAQALIIMLIVAGTETVASAMPRIAAILIDDNQWHRCTQNLSSLPNIISEGLRITVPAPAILHGVKQNITIQNHTFKKDSRILILLINIMRDSSIYPNAFNLDPNREYDPKYRNFWFGAGPHFCIGAQLAQRELLLIFQTLLTHLKNPKITARKYTSGSSFPGYQRLLITNANP